MSILEIFALSLAFLTLYITLGYWWADRGASGEHLEH